jgi:hypothetical protein
VILLFLEEEDLRYDPAWTYTDVYSPCNDCKKKDCFNCLKTPMIILRDDELS